MDLALAKPQVGTAVCRLEEIADGGGRMFTWPVNGGESGAVGEFRLLVLRSGEQCFGYENRCPHFGVPLAARDDQLIVKSHLTVSCNTHYARFRWTDGYCESGECAGEFLPVVPLTVANGIVCLA